jgi:hypothetical protein
VTAPGAAQEPPASVLMRAAKKMREDAEACGDPPGSFIPAVADWLESEAKRAAEIAGYEDSAVYPLMLSSYRLPLAVASGYLGERETEAGHG